MGKENKMKIAYISHHKRPCYEYNWFSKIEDADIKFLDTNFSLYPKQHPVNTKYCLVKFKENQFLNKFLHSSASIVKYLNFEKYLQDVDAIITLEVFSSLSKQFVKYCKHNNKKSLVLVYELIDNHPIYKTHFLNKNYVIKNADLFICVSHKAKEHLIKLGAPKKKIKVIYPGIDLSVFNCGSDCMSDNGITRLVFTGKLEKHKGIDDLLFVFEKLNKKNRISLVLCGNGSLKEFIETYCKKYDNIKYLGKVENSILPSILCKNDIYLFPAKDTYRIGFKIGAEQYGFSVVEAMACGLPIVAYDCGAIKEIIGRNNHIVKQNDIEGFVDKIQILIDNKKLRENIGAKNIVKAKKEFDDKKQAKLLLEILNEI